MNFNSTNISSLISEQHALKLLSTTNRVLEICDIIESKGYKLIINRYNNLILTNDTSLIIENLRLTHPIQLLLKENLTKVVDKEYFVIFFGKMLAGIKELFLKGMKVQHLVDGLRDLKINIRKIAEDFSESCSNYEEILRAVLKNQKLEELMIEAIKIVSDTKTCLSNSNDLQRNYELDNNQTVDDVEISQKMAENDFNTFIFPDNLEDLIRIVKITSGSLSESFVLNGMAFDHTAEGKVKNMKNVKTAIYNCPIDINMTETKGTVLFKKASEMLNFSQDEEAGIRDIISSLSADVLISNGNVGDLHLDYLNQTGKLIFKIPSKHDIRRIQNCLGGSISPIFKKLNDNQLGYVSEIETFYDGGCEYTTFKSKSKIATIVLKDSIGCNLDEYERSLNSSIAILKTLKKKIRVIKNFELKAISKLQKYSPESTIKPVYDILIDSLKGMKRNNCRLSCCAEENMHESLSICEDKIRAICCAFEMVIDIMMIEDYLVSNPEGITPRMNPEFN
ncbi:T-complex protein 1 subunit theta [Dictyocoela muelleri]|nr:T-complex protein 1 subunit theta [Dictyocoela muelleri]